MVYVEFQTFGLAISLGATMMGFFLMTLIAFSEVYKIKKFVKYLKFKNLQDDFDKWDVDRKRKLKSLEV
jgi:hypothetical protein